MPRMKSNPNGLTLGQDIITTLQVSMSSHSIIVLILKKTMTVIASVVHTLEPVHIPVL